MSNLFGSDDVSVAVEATCAPKPNRHVKHTPFSQKALDNLRQ